MNWEVLGQGLSENANLLAGGFLKEYERQVEEKYNIRRELRAQKINQENTMFDAGVARSNMRAQAEINKTTELELMKERAIVENESSQAREDYSHNLDNFLGDPEFLHGFQANVLSGNPVLMAQSLAHVKLVDKLKGGGEDMSPEDEAVFSTLPPASQGKLQELLLRNKDIGIGFKTKLLDLDATHARIRYDDAITQLYTAQTDTGKVTPAQVQQWDKEHNAIKLQIAGILTSKDWQTASMICNQNRINLNDPKVMVRVAEDPSFLQSVIPQDQLGMIGTVPQLAQIIIQSRETADRLKEASDLFRGKIKAYGEKDMVGPPAPPKEEEPAPEVTPPPEKGGGGLIRNVLGGSKFNISTGQARKKYKISKDHQVFAAWDSDSMDRAFERAKEGDAVLVRRGEKRGVYIFYMEDGKLRTRLLSEPREE